MGHSYLSKLIIIIHQTQSYQNKAPSALRVVFYKFCVLPTIFLILLPVNLITCISLEQNREIIILKDYTRGHKTAPKIALLLGIIIFVILCSESSVTCSTHRFIFSHLTSLYNNITQRCTFIKDIKRDKFSLSTDEKNLQTRLQRIATSLPLGWVHEEFADAYLLDSQIIVLDCIFC